MGRIAREIVSYLDQHPQAADTAAGIQRWWLSAETAADGPSIADALAELRARGLVRRTSLKDGTELYARGDDWDRRARRSSGSTSR